MKKEKAVKSYQRKGKNGKMVTVKAHSRSYESAEEMAKKAMASKKGAGGELAAKKKSVKEIIQTKEGQDFFKAWSEQAYMEYKNIHDDVEVSDKVYDKIESNVRKAHKVLKDKYGTDVANNVENTMYKYADRAPDGRAKLKGTADYAKISLPKGSFYKRKETKSPTGLNKVLSSPEGKAFHKAWDKLEHAMWLETEKGGKRNKVSKESHDKMLGDIKKATDRVSKKFGKKIGSEIASNIDSYVEYTSTGRTRIKKETAQKKEAKKKIR